MWLQRIFYKHDRISPEIVKCTISHCWELLPCPTSSSSDLPLLCSVAFFSLAFYSLHKQSQWNKKEDRMECWFAANICTFPWDCRRKSGPWRAPCVTGTAVVSGDCFKRFEDSSWWLCRSSLYNVFFLNWVRCLSKAMQHIHVREITNGN